MIKKNISSQTGQMFILSLIALAFITVTTMLLISGAMQLNFNSKYSTEAIQTNSLAEAGLDKAVASLNSTGGNYNGEQETLLGEGTYEVKITSLSGSDKLVESTAYIPNKANAKVKRTVKTQISKGDGISFNYGMQIGEGGISMGNGAVLNGSVYSNGNITAGNGSTITGDVYVAGGVQPTADQQTDCSGINCQDFIFGKNVNGNNQLDIAQSFKPTSEARLSKIALKLKKTGSPPNLTVRILTDNSGKPSKTVLTTGTLYANLVTTQYGFVEIAFSNPPTLSANTTYWIMVDTTSDPSNYWAWQGDTLLAYGNGAAKWSSNWNASNPVWNNPTPQVDLSFKTFMGGVSTSINMSNGSTINGNVHANTIAAGTSLNINGDAYYQTLGSSVTVHGTSYPNSQDPAPTTFPVSDANITSWKDQATAAGITNGSINGGNNCVMSLGPGKIVGNITLGNDCTVTVKSPIWVTGNITVGNSTKFKLNADAGPASGLIIVDGKTTLANGADLQGSGTQNSYLTLLSLYDSRTNGNEAVEAGNSAISGILYAPFGKVELANGAKFKEITAWQIDLGNSAILNYDSGLSSVFFSSGPSGAYSIIKGTYQAK